MEPDAQNRKRKRVSEMENDGRAELAYKRRIVSGTATPGKDSDSNDATVNWEDYFGQWPPEHRDQDMENNGNKRLRTQSQSSYSQQVRDGESPAAWTRQHELKMQEAGVIMTSYGDKATITDDCQQLCRKLLDTEYTLPTDQAFEIRRLSKVVERAGFCNEARIVRDIMPAVCPSPELLHIDKVDGLEKVCEALSAEWTKCDTLGGPKPKPDFVAGITALAFTEQERHKLQMNHTSASPNIFPENMYFPFLVCEAKSSGKSIQEAERQVMHSASIAVRAVVQLHKKASLVGNVDQRILVFSVAHDNSAVKVFGHFAKMDGDRTTFFRHRLFSGELAADIDNGRWPKAYHVVRAIYQIFFSQHLARIKQALSHLREPSLSSFTSQLNVDDNSQDLTSSQTSLQEDGASFKKPTTSATAQRKQNERMLTLLQQQQVIMEQQLAESRQQKAIMEQQLTQQKEESRQQQAKMEKLQEKIIELLER